MAINKPKLINWRPAGCSDAIDGAEAFEGAAASLQNLVPSPKTAHQWVARPAATSTVTISSNNLITAGLVVGTTVYGMVSNGLGQDVPFAYSISSASVLNVAGVNSAVNTASSQTTVGDWTPPILAQVGSRIVVTHPGFSNTAISAARASSFTATGISGAINGAGGYTLAQPGDILTGVGVPSNTTVLTINAIQGQESHCAGTIGANTFTFQPATTSGSIPYPGFAVFDNSNIGIRGFITACAGSVLTWSGTNPNTFAGATLYWGGDEFVISQAFTTGTTLTPSGITATGNTWQSVGLSAPTGASYKFGWFDISGASIQYTAAITSGSPIISLTTAFGVQPGLLVSGGGLAATTTLINLSQPSLTFTGTPPNFGDTTLTIQFSASAVSNAVVNMPLSGMIITGAGIAPGTTVAAPPFVQGLSLGTGTIIVPLSIAAPGTVGLNTASYIFTGLVVGILAANATTTSATALLTFTGGTPTAPLWYAGDTAFNPLPSQPVSVAMLAGRAYFACDGNGFVYSDSGLPCQRTYPSQALVPLDGLSISALGELPLLSPITGGIVQAIIGFAGVKAMYQITGDAALGNLSLNKMNIATGTHAPLSIIGTNFGLAFISPDGLRIVDFSGKISDPIGDPGSSQQIAFPFINAQFPTRISGAATANSMRWTVNNGGTNQDWVFDISRKQWHGPHTFVYSMIQPFKEFYLCQPIGFGIGTLFTSSLIPVGASSYTENGAAITYNMTTVLLPENDEQNALRLGEASIFVGSLPANPMTITGFDERNVQIFAYSNTPSDMTAYQRMFQFDLQQIDVFTQLQVQLTGNCDSTLVLGRMMLKYQDLGYQRYIGSVPLPSAPGGGDALTGAGGPLTGGGGPLTGR